MRLRLSQKPTGRRKKTKMTTARQIVLFGGGLKVTKMPEWHYRWDSYLSALSEDEVAAEYALFRDAQEQSPVFSAFWKKRFPEGVSQQ